MDAVTSLNNELNKLEQIIKVFKVGATAARQQTIEDKIIDAVNTVTVSDAKLLSVKAKIEELKQPPDEESVDETNLILLLDEYEKEMAKFVLMKSFWQHGVEASAIYRKKSGDTPLDEETSRFVDKSLDKIAEMLITLHEMEEEEQEITKKRVEKTEELETLLNNKEKLEEVKKTKQDLSSQEDTEILQLKKNNELKLEKLNAMRFLMNKIMIISKADYLSDSKWTDLLLEIQNPITMQELASAEMQDIASLLDNR